MPWDTGQVTRVTFPTHGFLLLYKADKSVPWLIGDQYSVACGQAAPAVPVVVAWAWDVTWGHSLQRDCVRSCSYAGPSLGKAPCSQDVISTSSVTQFCT